MQVLPAMSSPAVPRKGWDLQRLAITQFRLHSPSESNRAEVERCIMQSFAQRYDAKISHFSTELISLNCERHICAAVGLTPAVCGKLFAEQYIDTPIDSLIAKVTGRSVQRRDVLEIGNLFSSWKGSSLLLFVFLGELMHALGYTWAVFTATPEVERLLAKLNFAPTVITQADPSRISNSSTEWGSYYQKTPHVVFGEIEAALKLARQGAMYRTMAALLAPQVNEMAARLSGYRL